MQRRSFLKTTGAVGAAAAMHRTGRAAELPPGKAQRCVMMWLGGGMSQIDTFDPKRRGDSKQRKTGSDYDAIPTAVSEVQVCEHLPRVADRMDRITAVRTVYHDVIDEHAAAVNRVHTGRPTTGTVLYPSIGSIVAHQLGAADEGVPAYVLIGYPNVTRGPGFLGAQAGYLYLTDTQSGPRGLARPDFVTPDRQQRRAALLGAVRQTAAQRWPDAATVQSYDQAIAQSQRLSGEQFMRVFDLQQEAADLRNAYGGEFGQRCLLTRRLLQRGVRFVEVAHNLNFVNGTGWDTHREGQQKQHVLIRELDHALATLIDDLQQHDMLDDTLIVVATEFGRPPEFDSGGGRGHQSTAFTMALAGGGLRHCGAIGTTDELAKEIVDRPVSIPDFHATVHHALGIDYQHELYDGERPVPITDRGQPIAELFA